MYKTFNVNTVQITIKNNNHNPHLLPIPLKPIIYFLRRCPWCNDYRCRKWTQRHEFKSWMRLIAFPHSTNTLGKGMNPIILPPAMGK